MRKLEDLTGQKFEHPSGIECIQVVREMNFNLGNAVKYIWRAGLKNDIIEDLKKARWYLNDEYERINCMSGDYVIFDEPICVDDPDDISQHMPPLIADVFHYVWLVSFTEQTDPMGFIKQSIKYLDEHIAITEQQGKLL